MFVVVGVFLQPENGHLLRFFAHFVSGFSAFYTLHSQLFEAVSVYDETDSRLLMSFRPK